MKPRKILLLQSLAAILAVESRSLNQGQSRVDRQPIVQSQGAIAKLLAKSQFIVVATL